MRSRFFFTLPLTLLLPHHPLPAEGLDQTPAQPSSVVILELFTSEGCSSCPPADALLQQVHLRQTAAGQLIVGISEHVNYWNNLGWKDPYSQQTFTDRQQLYAEKLSPAGPYTPQMVLNGRDQFVGSSSASLGEALRAEAHQPHADLRLRSLRPQGDGLDLQFSLSGAPQKALDLVAVLTDDTDRSNVLRGENSGRSLQHVSVARSLARVATVTGDTTAAAHVPLPATFQHSGPAAGHHLILFAQMPHQGAIIAAAVMPL